jgi:hypothetical protein
MSFIAALVETGSPGAAAEKVGVTLRAAYKRREQDASFRAAWDAAHETSVDLLEAEARRRAYEGVSEHVYRGGEWVEIRKYSDALLMFLLKAERPEKYRENYDVEKLAREIRRMAQTPNGAPTALDPADSRDDRNDAE